MQSNRITNKGITLIEMLIVFAIIATISATLWMVLAPRVLVSARKAAITSSLEQASHALAIYRADNDDAFPGDWDDFGYSKQNSEYYISKGANRTIPAPPEFPTSWQTESSLGEPKLTYLYNRGTQKLISKYIPRYPFDEHTSPIFSAEFFQKIVNPNGQLKMFSPPNMQVYTSPGAETVKLTSFTDGHVAWRPFIEDWQLEIIYRTQYGDQ